MSKNIRVGVGLFVLIVFNVVSLNAFAEAPVISSTQLQQVINANHAGWTAKDNWVTRLPRDQIKRMMGVQKTSDMDALFKVPMGITRDQFKTKDLPAALDWRNNNGVDWVSPILNQGNCGSCVAFSTVATLETQVNITSGIPGMNPQFSTQALFTCGGGACDFGWFPDLAAQYLQKTGVPDEACDPYTLGSTGVDVDCSAACADKDARSLKIVGYTTPTTGTEDIDAVKAALQNGPLTTQLNVYDDFLYYAGGVYKHVSGDLAGGHAVSIVGYSDTDRAWIVRNSWGPNWGENGFIRVSYDDTSGVSNNTWQYEVPKADGYVTLYSPRNRMYMAGTSHLQANSTFPNTDKITVTIANSSSRASVYSQTCQSNNCSLDMDTTTMADGAYDAVATASMGQTTENSEHEVFYILNGAPTMSLSFTGQGVDLTKPLSDRVVFNVNAQSAPVPLQTLQFHVAQNGKDVYSNSSVIVVPGMTMGWRTGNVQNGTYDIYFTGSISPEGKQTYNVESNHMTVTVQNPASS